MVDLPEFHNSGRAMYDYAVTGLVDGLPVPIPFLAGQTEQYPYVRESSKGQRDQMDFSTEPGEQSLSGWWYRSQSSFDLGSGIEFMDSVSDQHLSRRFNDSAGVNVFEPGKVSLLRSTALAHSSASNVPALASYHAGGDDGVLHAGGSGYDTVTAIAADGTKTVLDWGGDDQILDFCAYGNTYYILSKTGVYYGGLPGTSGGDGRKAYNVSNASQGRIRLAKGRLIATINNNIYELALPLPTSATALPSPLGSGPTTDWIWSDIADGADSVFLSGYAGDQSSIYAIGLDDAAAVPTLTAPRQVASMPRGEICYSIETYMGAFLAVGTSLGLRVSPTSSDGRISVGPLTFQSDIAVKSVIGWGSSFYAGGAFVNELGSNLSTVTKRYGLYRVNLRSSITDNNGYATGLYGWAKDIHYAGIVASGTSTNVNAIAPVGLTGRLAFLVQGQGVVMESATEKVARGYLTTGRIRMDTWEDKVFPYLRVTTSTVDGAMTAQWSSESDNWTTLYAWDTDGVMRVDTEASDGDAHLFAMFRFVLRRGDASTASSPVLTGYQVRSQPSGVTQRNIRLSLLCFPREKTASGQIVDRQTWYRLAALEAAEDKGAPVLFQDLGTGEKCLATIEQMQFVATTVPSFSNDRKEPGGVLLLTLRKVA